MIKNYADTIPGYDDLRIDGLMTTKGVTAPTDETGFRGNANFIVRNFVHNAADEVQFPLQMPHHWLEGSPIFPHAHFSPWIANAGSAAVRLVMEMYIAKPFDQYPAGVATYTMSYAWSGDKQWYHLIASNETPLAMTGMTISTVAQCRLYRDNTVANNLAGKITFQYLDIHYKVDRPYGSRQEYIK